RITRLATLANPPEQLRRVEQAAAVIDQGRRHAVFELEKDAIAAFDAGDTVENGGGAHALDETATDLAYHIHLMRTLVENRTMMGLELRDQPRAMVEFVEVPTVDHAQRPVGLSRDQLVDLAHRRVEAMGMAGEQLDAGLFRRLDHLAAIGERQSHRLFDDHM